MARSRQDPKRDKHNPTKTAEIRDMDTAAEPRPGDEDFDGFRMRLPEDCVEYMLFIIGDKASGGLPTLEAVRKAADRKLDELAKDYIWQREPFRLETKVQKGVCVPGCLVCLG